LKILYIDKPTDSHSACVNEFKRYLDKQAPLLCARVLAVVCCCNKHIFLLVRGVANAQAEGGEMDTCAQRYI